MVVVARSRKCERETPEAGAGDEISVGVVHEFQAQTSPQSSA